MDKFKFEFAGFQDDAVGGVFPLFTVTHRFIAHPVLIQGTTLSGKGLFQQGFIIPSYTELDKLFKGDTVALRYRETENVSLENKIPN